MTDEELKALFEGLRQENAAAHADTRLQIGIAAERTRHEVQLVAEKVLQLDEKLNREGSEGRGEMHRGFTETQALIKFSHAELDRRVRSLEEGLSSLEARVERLESTH